MPNQYNDEGAVKPCVLRHRKCSNLECWPDKVFVEHLWKRLEYDEVYRETHHRMSRARRSCAHRYPQQPVPAIRAGRLNARCRILRFARTESGSMKQFDLYILEIP